MILTSSMRCILILLVPTALINLGKIDSHYKYKVKNDYNHHNSISFVAKLSPAGLSWPYCQRSPLFDSIDNLFFKEMNRTENIIIAFL